MHVFTIDTTDDTFLFKEIPITVEKSYAILALDDYFFMPLIDGASDADVYEFSLHYDTLAYGHTQKRSQISGEGLELDAAGFAQPGTGAGALSYCGPKTTDKKMWFLWVKWNGAASMLATASNSHDSAEITPSSGFDTTCMAVSVDESDVTIVYYAIGVESSENSGDFDFYVLKLDWDSDTANQKQVTSNILSLEVADHEHIDGGTQYGASAD